ncbi:MAG: type II secretion system GspH family protein [Candidatus Gastranaerophilales bacterium]|nr:type II secretion system GspH family protein [Candidatus Gastranaerophilales bacterium]
MKKALTIGELLITMAIIGTIATLVLPGFLKDYHKKLYVTRLKKTVEMLENAVNQACIDNNVSYFYQTPYVQPGDGSQQQAFIDKYFRKASGVNTEPFAAKYKILNSGIEQNTNLVSSHGWAKLASGEAISFYCANSVNFCVFRVDINSTDGPNIGGRDYFALFINKNNNEIYDKYEVAECGTTNDGLGCYARLLQDNWEMKY